MTRSVMERICRQMLFRSIGCLVFLALVTGCAAWPYTGSSIRAKVVDSTNGKPLSGVMVVASWYTFTTGFGIGIYMDGGGPPDYCEKLVNVETATSGSDGSFTLSAWGPKSGCLTMSSAEPELLLYKPGYKTLRLLNITDPDFDPDDFSYLSTKSTKGPNVVSRSSSRWNGRSITLTPVGATPGKHDDEDTPVDNLAFYESALSGIVVWDHSGRCVWKDLRPAILLVMQEERRLSRGYLDTSDDEIGPFQFLDTPEDWSGYKGCKHFAKYIQGLKKEVGYVSPSDRAAAEKAARQLGAKLCKAYGAC